MNKLTLRDKLRSRNVTRWHTVLTVNQQSVSEHSHCMSLITDYLLDKIFENTKYKILIIDKYYCLKYAQLHDLHEIIVGDISSVFRAYLKQTIADFSKNIDQIELELTPELKEIYSHFHKKKYLKLICKAADLLEALSYFYFAKGNDEEHNEIIINKLKESIKSIATKGKINYPKANWSVINETINELLYGGSAIIELEKIDIVKSY
jgi:5'-deoxynucleotidase YfbR-like HD superfamily hydrolase